MPDPPSKRRGRPPVDPDATPTRVQVTLSAKMYDALFQRAQAKEITVPEAIRRSIEPGHFRYK